MPFLRRRRSNCGPLSSPRLWLRRGVMVKKKILNPDRIRRITAGFSFIPHRFLGDGFLSSLQQKELLLYLFLVIVSDPHGLSFYSYDAICSLLWKGQLGTLLTNLTKLIFEQGIYNKITGDSMLKLAPSRFCSSGFEKSN
jgi:hypothetical protein